MNSLDTFLCSATMTGAALNTTIACLDPQNSVQKKAVYFALGTTTVVAGLTLSGIIQSQDIEEWEQCIGLGALTITTLIQFGAACCTATDFANRPHNMHGVSNDNGETHVV